MNTSGCPKRYRAEFIEPGVVSYEDVGQGKVFVSKDALDRMCASFVGKPVVNVVHQDLTFEQAFKLSDEDRESMADGIVFNCGWLPNGWGYADMIIWDLDTQKNIDEKRFNVSCAYVPTEVGINGKWHNIDYDEEVKNGNYTHMAIVNNPRYERAKIYELPKEYQNSIADGIIEEYNKLQSKEKTMLFFWKTKKNEGAEQKTETTPPASAEEKVNADDAMVDINGQQVPLSEIIKVYMAEQAEIAKKTELEQAAAQATEKKPLNPDDQVDVGDGKKVLVSELMACYARNSANAMQNAEGEGDGKDEGKDEGKDGDGKPPVEKQNATQTKPPAPKTNANFKAVQNAVDKAGQEFKVNFMTENQRFELGQKRYGSKQGGK